MRPPRVIIAGAFFLATVFLTFVSLRSSHTHHSITTTAPSPSTGLQSFFSFRAPFSLFPPNAIITLTHENSTAFLARPAAFGPLLPTEGLKGQVWIGSGFGDDAGIEGELGCSDVPGWVDSYAKSSASSDEIKLGNAKAVKAVAKSHKRSASEDNPFDEGPATPEGPSGVKGDSPEPAVDDGTDDYLHHPLPESTVSKPSHPQALDVNSDHADIQSIQEGAEITGKVVLLSRGGCGFLEKVKWSQRRGAIALIVGDDVKGGPLIQMYARGDTSNVTIPSIFTSRTTAHLLSSLVGSGTFMEESIDENGNPTLKVKTDKLKKGKKKYISNPTFTPTSAVTKPTMTARAASKASNKKPSTRTDANTAAMTTQRPAWWKSLFFGTRSGKSRSDSSRPPSSGQLDWVLVDDWRDDDSSGTRKVSKPKAEKKDEGKVTQQKSKGGDDFVIGVQDWRDPDLVGSKENELGAAKVGEKSDVTRTKDDTPRPTKAGKKHTGGALQDIPEYIPPLRGGSITPGSGEYGGKVSEEEDKARAKEEHKESSSAGEKAKGLLTAIFGDDEEDIEFPVRGSPHTTNYDSGAHEADEDDGEYEGLWVTLTPTSGTSPFLDTLLVLVVSPLVTLTIVYALLLVRSRIRRRRWRAPKSVVERLPVRTYQTIATPGNRSPRLPNPSSSSATTPLLQNSPPTRPRPRSRTTTGIPEPSDLARINSQPLGLPPIHPRVNEHEKIAGPSTEWKKYMGKQVECVVCLEEYVDGVSRVMSLPCGHEFHVDCM
jgi:hypothetical protein